jgi:hypothetical protein
MLGAMNQTVYLANPSSNYWISRLTLSGMSTSQLAIDSTNNVFISGSYSSNGLVVKLNGSGQLQWANTYYNGTNATRIEDVAVDSSGVPYAVGYEMDGTFVNGVLVFKLNTSNGSMSLQRRIYNTSGALFVSASRAVIGPDGGSVLYTGSTDTGGGTVGQYFGTTNTSTGNTTLARHIFTTNRSLNANGVGTNGTDIWISGDDYNNIGNDSTTPDLIVAKWNVASGAFDWTRRFEQGGAEDGCGIAVDSSGNSYVSVTIGSSVGMIVSKISSTGGTTWSRTVEPGASNTIVPFDIALDSSGNIYASAYYRVGGGNYQGYVVKFDTNGNVLWQRVLDSNNVQQYVRDIKIAANGDMVWLVDTNVTGSDDIIRLPADGSLTGTYVLGSTTYTYSSASLTVSTSSPSFSPISATFSSASVTTTTQTNGTHTNTSQTPTNTVVTI